MATTTTTRPTSLHRVNKKPTSNQPRPEIWSSLLKATREAQYRNRKQSPQSQSHSLLLLGGSPQDQRDFTERYVARPPPAQPPTRNQREQRTKRLRGEVKLSNRFGVGFGYVGLYAPPQTGSVGLFAGEPEEVAKVEVHTVPEPEKGYESSLRRLLRPKKEDEALQEGEGENEDINGDYEGRRPAVCILMSWKEPWVFLDRLRRWLELLARALQTAEFSTGNSPLEVIKEHSVNVIVVLQHTDHQEVLLRENYTEESFDYISQCIRTCLLPLSGAIVYVPTTLPPQQAGGPLSETQKVLYISLNLDTSALQAKGGKPDIAPKHNVVDRMAIVVPSGWDSAGKIRLLSETFSPEAMLEGWTNDLSIPIFPDPLPQIMATQNSAQSGEDDTIELQTTAGSNVEVYASSHQPSPLAASPNITPPLSPSKQPKSAIRPYEDYILDPNAHKAPKPPEIEVTTQPEQEFLAEMKQQLVKFEAEDAEAARGKGGAHTTSGALSTPTTGSARLGANTTATGEALSELGDVSFNVGGVSYNTVSAEEAIERLKRPQHPSSSSTGGGSRSGTPRPGRRELRGSDSREDGSPGSGKGDVPVEELEEYFASLMKKGGGGGGSRSGTPSRR